MSTSNKDRYYSSMGESRRSSPGDSRGSVFPQTGHDERAVLPPPSSAFPAPRFSVPVTYFNPYTQPRSSLDGYDLNPQPFYRSRGQPTSSPPRLSPAYPSYDAHEKYSPQPLYGYSSRLSPPVMCGPSDSRRPSSLTTSSHGGDRWQQPDYGIPTTRGYPTTVCSPTASYPITCPNSNQTSSCSNHMSTSESTSEHHPTDGPDHRPLFDDLDATGDPRSSSPYSWGSGSSQVSSPSYTPPPSSPTSPEEPTIKKKRKSPLSIPETLYLTSSSQHSDESIVITRSRS